MTTYNHRVKDTFTHTYGDGRAVVVPAGARTQSASAHGEDFRWVDPSTFPAGSIERHDAEYRGIRVYPDNSTSERA
jgi:hypothetical protein